MMLLAAAVIAAFVYLMYALLNPEKF
ncbi:MULTISPECIES: K(+)-transporting ATPase subunit F [Bacillus]|nr:K(+)-transporting ATPase subunit F [Bacillus sp. (in: firmicutes)]PAD60114.1 K(+)-transporting ATPase subunit F [Bacillus sonorensis]RHJ11204.1 K(+)-transporting ATPase subunit F [Bacillus sonorensis]